MTGRAGGRLLAFIAGIAASGAALAHANGTSYLRIASADAGAPLTATWDIAAADLQLPLELDTDGDGVLTADELAARSAALARFATDRLDIRRGGIDCVIHPGTPTLGARESETFVSLPLQAVCAADGSLEVSTSLFFGSAGYSALLDVRTPKHRLAAALSMNGATWTEPRVPSVLATGWRFLREGVGHVSIGYDHIAFLLLLLLPSVLRASPSGWIAAANGRRRRFAIC